MLKKKVFWGIAMLMLAISFTYFTGSVYAGKAAAPIPQNEYVNLDRTIIFYFDANGVSQSDVELQVCKTADGFGKLEYQVSNISSPHTSSKSFTQGESLTWRMKNLSTGEVSPTRTVVP